MIKLESKRLYRSRKQSVISGVCGGIGEYFNIDPVVVRVLWLVIGLSLNGTGIVLYIIAAIVIPKEPKKINISQEPYPFEENKNTKADSDEDEDIIVEATSESKQEKSTSKVYSTPSPVEKESSNMVGVVIGILLIFIGGFILAGNFFNFNVDLTYLFRLNFNYIRVFAKYFWPICLILLGLVFFVKSK